ncbi:MAG: hypothetical protein K1000chlam2_00359 [Chlamydiae bacterium]|nr:hypothetical protein [Chlamydiota bacterium]
MKITQNVWQSLSHQIHTSRNILSTAAIAVAMLVAAVVTPILLAMDLCPKPFQGSKPKPMSIISILDFYRGGKNDQGATLEEIWSRDDGALEGDHSYIQWLFPLKGASKFNPTASLTDGKTMSAFKGDKVLQEKLFKSLKVMLKFYGFTIDGQGQIAPSRDFVAKSKNWLNRGNHNRGNHNYLRISRILESLCLHGLKPHAEAFLKALEGVYQKHSKDIGATTLSYWKGSVH